MNLAKPNVLLDFSNYGCSDFIITPRPENQGYETIDDHLTRSILALINFKSQIGKEEITLKKIIILVLNRYIRNRPVKSEKGFLIQILKHYESQNWFEYIKTPQLGGLYHSFRIRASSEVTNNLRDEINDIETLLLENPTNLLNAFRTELEHHARQHFNFSEDY